MARTSRSSRRCTADPTAADHTAPNGPGSKDNAIPTTPLVASSMASARSSEITRSSFRLRPTSLALRPSSTVSQVVAAPPTSSRFDPNAEEVTSMYLESAWSASGAAMPPCRVRRRPRSSRTWPILLARERCGLLLVLRATGGRRRRAWVRQWRLEIASWPRVGVHVSRDPHCDGLCRSPACAGFTAFRIVREVFVQSLGPAPGSLQMNYPSSSCAVVFGERAS